MARWPVRDSPVTAQPPEPPAVPRHRPGPWTIPVISPRPPRVGLSRGCARLPSRGLRPAGATPSGTTPWHPAPLRVLLRQGWARGGHGARPPAGCSPAGPGSLPFPSGPVVKSTGDGNGRARARRPCPVVRPSCSGRAHAPGRGAGLPQDPVRAARDDLGRCRINPLSTCCNQIATKNAKPSVPGGGEGPSPRLLGGHVDVDPRADVLMRSKALNVSAPVTASRNPGRDPRRSHEDTAARLMTVRTERGFTTPSLKELKEVFSAAGETKPCSVKKKNGKV